MKSILLLKLPKVIRSLAYTLGWGWGWGDRETDRLITFWVSQLYLPICSPLILRTGNLEISNSEKELSLEARAQTQRSHRCPLESHPLL